MSLTLKNSKIKESIKIKVLEKKNLSNNFYLYKTLLGNKLRFTNPESYEYIKGLTFTNNTFFDLKKSLILFKRALTFMRLIKKRNGNILFIGTRYDLKKIIKKLGLETGLSYINHRWVKGFLTNWENTSNSIKFYNLFLKKLDMRSKKKIKMEKSFLGVKNMTKLPDAIFLFDLNNDRDILNEAKSLNIPIIAIVDTNTSLKKIDYPIPGNSESLLSLIFYTNIIGASLKL